MNPEERFRAFLIRTQLAAVPFALNPIREAVAGAVRLSAEKGIQVSSEAGSFITSGLTRLVESIMPLS